MTLLKLQNEGLLSVQENAQLEIAFEDWQADPTAADASAIVVPNDVRVDEELAQSLSKFSTIVLEFPAFKDGRAYSQATLLRDRFGFDGELRARGNVLQDQLLFMVRCGFDAFEYEGNEDLAAESIRDFSVAYQRAADAQEPVWVKRLKRNRAAA